LNLYSKKSRDKLISPFSFFPAVAHPLPQSRQRRKEDRIILSEFIYPPNRAEKILKLKNKLAGRPPAEKRETGIKKTGSAGF